MPCNSTIKQALVTASTSWPTWRFLVRTDWKCSLDCSETERSALCYSIVFIIIFNIIIMTAMVRWTDFVWCFRVKPYVVCTSPEAVQNHQYLNQGTYSVVAYGFWRKRFSKNLPVNFHCDSPYRYGLCDLVSIWGDFFKFVTMVKLSFTPVQDPGVKPDTEKEKQDGVPAVYVVPVTVPGDGIDTKDAELAVSISQNNPKW